MRAMSDPVRCVCGRVYDLGTVEVIARYADCSVWKAPCCGRTVDDNIWKTRHDFTRVSEEEDRLRQLKFGPYGMERWGS